MSHDPPSAPSANLQIFSPTLSVSGRSSPSPRVSRNTTEDSLQKKDKIFRRYAATVERALALWDTSQQEWADYISFLARLLKALQSHPPNTPVIPHSDAVALRLAQCLNPALPSGVHQKALEVYDFVFATIGNDDLSRDLNLYFPGLATVLSFASLSVRPLFLGVFESHILKLPPQALRPPLKAIILSLLPGLEDETSEDFERIVSALDKLRLAVKSHPDEISDARSDGSSSHFWQCFFLAVITNPFRRQGALAYLVRRLPKFGTPQRRPSTSEPSASSNLLSPEAVAAISPEPGLLIRCFESGLSDGQLLVQRGFLDLLVTHLPLDSSVLQQQISKEDLERLAAAAAGVVSRRDMSLNRRLWAWFLGPEPSSTTEGNESVTSPTQDKAIDPSSYHAAYFSRHGLQALTRSVLKMINRPSKIPTERARPFRVCLSLMDRWEVGGLIVPEVFLPALQSIYSYSKTATRDELDEVMRSASTFFDGVDSGLIWAKLVELVTSSLDPKASLQQALENLKLAKFVLSRFNLKEEEMVVYHMPLAVASTLAALNSRFTSKSTISREVTDLAFEITDSLIQLIPDRAIKSVADTEEEELDTDSIDRQTILQKVQEFYEESQGSLDASEPPFSAPLLGQLLLRESGKMFITSITPGFSHTTEIPSRILSNIIFKVVHLTALDELDPFAVFQGHLSSREDSAEQSPLFSHLSALTTVITALQKANPSKPYISESYIAELIHPLVTHLWWYLSPSMPKYHVEAVRCIIQLHTISPSTRMVEAAIASIIAGLSTATELSEPGSSDAGHRFAVLWTHTMYELSLQSENRGSFSRRHSGATTPLPAPDAVNFQSILTRPLLLLLDSLEDDESEMAGFVKTWLQNLPSLNKVLEVLGSRLQSLQCLSASDSLMPIADRPNPSVQPYIDDTKECLYYMKHIHNVLKQPSHYTWTTLAEQQAPGASQSESRSSLQEWLVKTSMRTLSLQLGESQSTLKPHLQDLYRISGSVINQIYSSSMASKLRELEIEVPLMTRLKTASPALQSLLLNATILALKVRIIRPEEPPVESKGLGLNLGHKTRLSISTTRDSVDVEPAPIPPPPQLVDTLKYGFSSSSSRLILDDWVHFLIEVLPLFADAIFQNLLPLVECFCQQINQTFNQLKTLFQSPTVTNMSPETTLISLVNGLEQILARAHDRLTVQETKITANKTPEVPQGFFGNMVSGVFTSDTQHTRTPTANSRLTVLLCFQDTVRICFAIWSWGGYGTKEGSQDPASASSFGYTSLRMRNRARRILEHLFAAEALECLETLIVLWAQAPKGDMEATAVIGLLNVLNGSKPRHTIPAIFNAVYSRTNPNAMDQNRMSTLTSNLSEMDLVSFLVDYTNSLEDDAMDEIWQDCSLFLRDVLANPMPHRQILPSLLEFTAVIGQKVDNTNFGEQRRMRKELADIFQRILTAVFTTRSMGYLQDPSQVTSTEKTVQATNGSLGQKRATDVVSVLNSIVPNLSIILVENDRVTNVVSSIATSVIGPTFRAKSFPENVSEGILDLLQALVRVAQGNKIWKKDLFDAFNDPRFFNTPLPLLKRSWLPILAQWTHSDKDRLPELLSRISAPTTAGLMFGVGATSARQEADRKTQLTLRRIALIILAGPEDAFTPSLPSILEKIVELLTATPASSPSSATRPEVLTLLRALILKTSPINLAPLWPTLNAELTSALTSLLPDAPNKEHYSNAGILQACKLLDSLVVLAPDDFQLFQWLYLSDTIDAVYGAPSDSPHPTNLCAEIAETNIVTDTPTSSWHARSRSLPLIQHPSTTLLTSSSSNLSSTTTAAAAPEISELKRVPFLDTMIRAIEDEEKAEVVEMARRELVERLVKPFLGGLAMGAFEAMYGGAVMPDFERVWEGVVGDVWAGS
ncbi:hypothetical protein DM02DRAFT_677280 [Periconia macrospinosa]|uniref:Uncharacterized protein n=1 Tax=Periconia macrospinosa TaxID=97972 RepID=A0A2V1D3Z0_9PLEO|nr:hypothetical protein DM02DRAFT_677280 [Periconia macrospinosa]